MKNLVICFCKLCHPFSVDDLDATTCLSDLVFDEVILEENSGEHCWVGDVAKSCIKFFYKENHLNSFCVI